MDGDVELFVRLARKVTARRIFVVGHSFGYSSFLLAGIFQAHVTEAS